MAKDDYFVLVYKILAYLYTVLKEGRSPDAKMLQYDSTLLGVNEPYWAYIMENLQAQGYITGLTVVAAWGGARSISNLERCQITPDGISQNTDKGRGGGGHRQDAAERLYRRHCV